MRTRLIAGNWKMNRTAMETEQFLGRFDAEMGKAELLICMPFTDLYLRAEAARLCRPDLLPRCTPEHRFRRRPPRIKGPNWSAATGFRALSVSNSASGR